YSRRYHAETPPLRRAATAAAAVVSVLVQERGWRTSLPTQMPESKKVPGAPKNPSPCPEHPVTAKRTAPNVGTNEVKTSVFVNLRQAPSPSAKVIRVVAKGTKLPVVAHKGRWVQVTDPANSAKGWIYTGNANPPGTRKPSAAAESSEGTQP